MTALVIRADAGRAMGTGHVMRCLALAQAWQHRQGEGPVHWASVELPDGLTQRLAEEDIRCHRLLGPPGTRDDASQVVGLAEQAGASWAVVDGYHFDGGYEQQLVADGLCVLAFDDHRHTEHQATLLLNQNIHARPELYPGWPTSRLLAGTTYALLRREFWSWRGSPPRRPAPQARRVLVTMGGTDPQGMSAVALAALADQRELELCLVLGGGNPALPRLRTAAHQAGAELVVAPADMAPLMAQADLALAAAGSTSWELLLLGVPSLLLVVADNQLELARELHRRNIAEWLGQAPDIEADRLRQRVLALAGDLPRRQAMARAGPRVVDGFGGDRVVQRMLEEG